VAMVSFLEGGDWQSPWCGNDRVAPRHDVISSKQSVGEDSNWREQAITVKIRQTGNRSVSDRWSFAKAVRKSEFKLLHLILTDVKLTHQCGVSTSGEYSKALRDNFVYLSSLAVLISYHDAQCHANPHEKSRGLIAHHKRKE